MRVLRSSAFAVIAVAALVACGHNGSSEPDASPPDAEVHAVCGNNKLEPGEECDDGNSDLDLVCDATCHLTCGNGTVDTSVGETCDTGIATGAGSCPTACDDGMACTSDLLSGTACEAVCINTPITLPTDGDGCCPTGANANIDNDCSPTCGNGVVESGEVCDTGIATGVGACPATCDDGMSCTTDTLMSAGTCQAACSHTAITLPKNNDGCCPTGANTGNDNDCKPGCGNGVVDSGETCDTAIATGTGKCPTTCSDGVACTKDVLANAGTCTAACTFPAITTPVNGDGCCPTGANANNDNDCQPVCGNKVVESGEQCDDGNSDPNDGCDMCKTVVVATAFRMSDLDLRDPHVFVNFIGCRDVTDTQLAGFAVNSSLQTSITTDGNDADTLLDLSIVPVFRPLVQTPNNATTPVDIYVGAACTSPMASTSCTTGTATKAAATATIMTGGQCLAALANTTHGYTPAITNPSAPCFVTSAVTVTINLGGIPITLHDARLAGTFVGNPAGTLTNGLLMGFISEADADTTIIPTTFPLVGGMPLSALLAGGKNACPTYSDKDMDGSTVGWWFYLNFPATKVPWTN